MTETSEEAGGFDRRSLIKKGLVIGGAATVLPVISTFNAPAFAASPLGSFVIVFDAAGLNGGVTRNPGYSVTAAQTSCNTAFAANDDLSVNIVATVSPGIGDKYNFTFGPGQPGCTFTSASVNTDHLLQITNPITDCSGPPSTVTPTLVQLDRNVAIAETRHILISVTCV